MYKVRVVRIMDYGAFVELPNGFQALLHISELAHHKVRLWAPFAHAAACLPNSWMAKAPYMEVCSRWHGMHSSARLHRVHKPLIGGKCLLLLSHFVALR